MTDLLPLTYLSRCPGSPHPPHLTSPHPHASPYFRRRDASCPLPLQHCRWPFSYYFVVLFVLVTSLPCAILAPRANPTASQQPVPVPVSVVLESTVISTRALLLSRATTVMAVLSVVQSPLPRPLPVPEHLQFLRSRYVRLLFLVICIEGSAPFVSVGDSYSSSR